MEWLGNLERGFANAIYPNRVLIAILFVIVVALVGVLAWRGRWDRSVRHRPRMASAGVGLGLVVIVPAAWYLASPLLLSTTIDEPAPIAVIASSPVPAATSQAPQANASPDPPTHRPSEATPTTPTTQPVTAIELSGSFAGADEFHFARGRARLVETAPGEFTIWLEDFAVRNGPDLFVYLSPFGQGYTKAAVELGRLKADRGNQNYRVPAGTDVGSVRSVVIWCKQFGVLFGTAPLT